MLAVCLRSHSIYKSVLYVLRLYVWNGELLLWDVTFFMYWTCGINCNCTSPHINNRKYSNSYTVYDECRQTIVCIDIAM